MKIVIDTNVLISAAFRDRDPEKAILYVVEQIDMGWIGTQEIITEYKEVLRRPKFKLPSNILKRWHAIIEKNVILVSPDSTISFPRDQKDAMFLECCLWADVDFFITGDRDFEEARKLLKTNIVSVRQFNNLFLDD